MRDYARVLPRFWTGDTGKSLRADRDAQVLALYLMTCPSSSMTGLYYLPLPTMAHETGLSIDQASGVLGRLSQSGFAYYDDVHEVVWVPQMARCQVGESLSPGDKRIKGILREIERHRRSRFYVAFIERYCEAFHLREICPAQEAPSEPLRSQDQEQEQEQDQEQEQEQKETAASASPSRPVDELFPQEVNDGVEQRPSPESKPSPLPFKPDEALRAVADASKGRFIASKLNRGQSIHAQKLIRQHPDLGEWQLVGEWLGAGGESWRTELDARRIGDFEAWLAHAQKWRDDGKPPIDRRARASPSNANVRRGQAPVAYGLDYSSGGKK